MKFNVYALLARLLPTATVDRAVGALNKFTAALAAAEAAQVARSNKLAEQIAALKDEQATADAEAARARRVAGRITDLTA